MSRIATTLKEEPHHFFYLNNGLTAFCERFEVKNPIERMSKARDSRLVDSPS